MCKYLQICANIYRCVQISTDSRKYLQTATNTYRQPQISTDSHKYLQTATNIYRYPLPPSRVAWPDCAAEHRGRPFFLIEGCRLRLELATDPTCFTCRRGPDCSVALCCTRVRRLCPMACSRDRNPNCRSLNIYGSSSISTASRNILRILIGTYSIYSHP